MTKNVSVRAFKCPSCGGPLEPETGTLTMKCPYCGGTVIIPESLRTPAASAGQACPRLSFTAGETRQSERVRGERIKSRRACSMSAGSRWLRKPAKNTSPVLNADAAASAMALLLTDTAAALV